MIRGRDLELGAIADLVDRARRGRAATLLVRGEAGIGKTTLLDEARRRAGAQCQVLATQGRAIDAEIGFASLLTLLRPVEDELDDLAGPQADAVRSALMMGQRAVDTVAVQLGVFRVLTALAERAPVLLVVDDAQHLDAATAAVLAFAVGRLDADPVAVVLTAETAAPTAFGDVVPNSLTLGPLDDDVLADLIRGDGAIDDDVLAHCCRLAGGNPLAALELARSLTPAERSGRAPAPLVPRPPAAVARGFTAHIDAAGAAVRKVLAVVAADDTGELDVVRDALGHLGESPDTLEEAESAGLIRIDGSQVRLAHPLLRAVAYHQVAPRSRRSAHRALARALDQPHHGAARAWQLAAAADGPDETAADALDLVALDAVRRGGPASAARIWQRAAALSADPAHRAARVAQAAMEWFAAGQIDRCRDCLTQLAELPVTAEALTAVGLAGPWVEGPRAAQVRLRHLAGRVEPSVMGLVRVIAADLSLAAGQPDEATAIAADLRTDPEVGPLAADVCTRSGACELPAGSSVEVGPLAVLAGVRRRKSVVEAGKLHEALSDIATISPLGGLVPPRGIDDQLTVIAARRHAGELNQAATHANLVLELLPDGADLPRAAVNVALADVECLLGRRDDARARLDRSIPVLAERQFGEVAAFADWVRARLARDDGDVDGSVAAFERAARRRPHVYGPDWAVAATLANEDREARRFMERWTSAPPGTCRLDPLPAVRVARAMAVVLDRPELFGRADQLANGAGLRCERAEVALVHCDWLAAHGQDPAAQAEVAKDLLARIGARAGRGRWNSRDGDTASEVEHLLSPAEFRVALAVAEGMTNKEAATALFVSVKTVDFHLQAIYRKLGVRSRTELAVRINRSHALSGARS